MTYLGAPMIYYGDEVGMWGANDPDCRKPMVWDDIDYEPETTRPDGSRRTPDSVAVNTGLLAFYKKLIGIRAKHPALLHGDYRTVLADDKRDLMVFERWEGSERIIVALNNSNRSQDYALKADGARWVDLMTGAEHAEVIAIPPKWGAILKPSGSP